jgi:hypothetical protein
MGEIISFCAMAAFLALAVLPWISALLGVVWLLAALQSKEAERAFRPVILCLAGVVLPFLVFIASYFLVPEWKGACRFGWLDCFHAGKLALTPLVLWACAAFVKYNKCNLEEPIPAWVVLGLCMGVVVSSVCVVVEFLVAGFRSWVWLVPCYVSVWYAKLALEARWSSRLPLKYHLFTLLSSLPFWVWGIIWSKATYQGLSDAAPEGCFIVTAASRGHENVVGPFSNIERRGSMRVVNRQLLIFWQFEALWQKSSPRSHRGFRRIYNFVGPYVARSIRTKVMADAVYLLLKPCEMMATIALSVSESSARRQIQGQHDV